MVNGKKTDHDHDILDFDNGQIDKLTNFDHLTTAILKFWPWSWSRIFDHLTMTPGSIGQMVKKSWSFSPLLTVTLLPTVG